MQCCAALVQSMVQDVAALGLAPETTGADVHKELLSLHGAWAGVFRALLDRPGHVTEEMASAIHSMMPPEWPGATALTARVGKSMDHLAPFMDRFRQLAQSALEGQLGRHVEGAEQ
eukprot:12662276-Alexandrium_andersonii.AAC.1